MSTDTHAPSRSHAKRGRKDVWEFRLLFAASFLVFFIAALIERLMPSYWLGRTGEPRKSRSILGEAKDAANTYVPYAFMG